MSKSLQDLLNQQDENEKTVDSQELTEINPEEADEIAGGARTSGFGMQVACDASC